jgi:hypothetical protein
MEKQIPDDWRPWLFGERSPAGVYVVGLPLQRLRMEMSPIGHLADGKACGILPEAGLKFSTLWVWQKNPMIREALESAREWAERTGAGDGLEPPWAETAKALGSQLKSNLIRYVRAAKTVSCCRRAGVSRYQYYQRLAEAEKLGVRELLENFVHQRPPFKGRKRLRRGLVAGNFFIPTEKMIAFREVARAEAVQLDLSKVLQEIKDAPGYEQWFLDWTNPRSTHKGVQRDGDSQGSGFVRPVRSVPLPTQLNQTEQNLVACVQEHGPIKGEELARQVGYPFNSYFRQTVSNLFKRGLLRKHPQGGYIA